MPSPTLNIIIRGGLLPETQKFAIRAGLTYSAHKYIINTIVRDLKGNGLWWDGTNGVGAYYPVIGGTAIAHGTNLIDPDLYRIVWVGGPAHSDQGVQFNGTTQYGMTGIIPSTFYSGDDNSGFSFYSRTTALDVLSNSVQVGAYDGTNNFRLGSHTSAGSTFFSAYTSANFLTTLTNTGAGFISLQRSIIATGIIYINAIAGDIYLSQSLSRPTKEFYVGAQNGNGTAASFSNKQISAFIFHSAFSVAKLLTLKNINDSLQTSLGRAV